MVLGINLYIATLSTDIKRGKQRLEKRRGKKNMTQNEAAKKARLDVVQTQVVRANGKQRSPAVKNDQSSTKSKVNHIENNNEVALRSVDRNVPNVAHPIYQLQELI